MRRGYRARVMPHFHCLVDTITLKAQQLSSKT